MHNFIKQKMETKLENPEGADQGPGKRRVWFKRLSDRLRTSLTLSFKKKSSTTSETLRHLFSAPIVRNKDEEDLQIIRSENIPVIWVIGGPGAPIQAFVDRLAKIYNFHHVMVGHILKQEIVAATGRVEMVNKLMNRGVVIPRQFLNEIIMRNMADTIERKNVRGFLFSDFPTTFMQAKTFLKKVQKVDFIIVLKFDNNTMKLNAFQLLKRQSLSSKKLKKTKEELKKAADEAVEEYIKDLSLLYKLYGKKIKIIEGKLVIREAYREMMRWIERAMVIHNLLPPFLPEIPVHPRQFSDEQIEGIEGI